MRPREDEQLTFRLRIRAFGLIAGLTSALAVASVQPSFAQSFSPVAIVNDQIITGYDVSQRALLNSITQGGGAASPDNALDELISDVLRLQAAKRAGIDPTPDEVRAGFDEISRINQRDPDQMRSGLFSRGITPEALDTQIKAEVAWRRLIVQRYGSRARVSDNDVDEVVGVSTGAKPGETEYLLTEIRLPIGQVGEAAKMAEARQIISELTAGATFANVARAKSSGPTSAAGGDLGWTASSKLSAKTAEVVGLMNVDRVSEPFVDGSDVVIVGLRATREAGGGARTTYTLAQLVIGVAPNAPQAEADAALARATALRAELTSCADVEPRKAQYLPISGNLGNLTLASMPGPVREAVAGLEPGSITQPVRSNDGFHVIVVCDKETQGPSGDAQRARAEDQLRAQRLERYARSLLRELKREAIIERR